MRKRFREIIEKYVPVKSVDYCLDLWARYPFSFKVSRQRNSKIGDYRFNKATGNHEISVNGNLNPYAFLITYLHEVAHLVHFRRSGNNRPPHGLRWKQAFQELMHPVLTPDFFPDDLLAQLLVHMKNPRASSHSDPVLTRLLRQYDPEVPDATYLEDLGIGETFSLNGRTFTKLKKRRTRSLCREMESGRNYLISELTKVRKSG